MLATKCNLAKISDEDVCYALICKRALFSLDDLASSLPPAVTNILQEYEDVFQLRYTWVTTYEKDRASN
jgi:hypothetical protein